MCLFHNWSNWEDKINQGYEHYIAVGSANLVIGYRYIIVQERHCKKCNLKQTKDNSIYIKRN